MELLGAQYFLNHQLCEDELREQVGKLADAGYEVIYGHARAGLETPYFSRSWWEAMEVIVDECRKHKIKFAIWDEDYYPSGVAGNRIMWEHPELTAQRLSFTVTPCRSSERFQGVYGEPGTILRAFAVELGGEIRDITEYSGSTRRHWDFRSRRTTAYSLAGKLPAPHWRAGLSHKSFGLEWQAPDYGSWRIVVVQVLRQPGGHNTDLMNGATTERFIELTHEAYYQRFKERFDLFHSSFLDEPAPDGLFPWTDALPQEFEARFQRNLLDLLPHLVLDINGETPWVRLSYREIQRRLLCRNYLEKIRQWDQKHGLLSIGHLTRTEYFSRCNLCWPNEVACYEHLDIPCCDPLGYHIAIPEARAYHTAIKVVTSAERHFHKRHSGSDALAVMGNEATLEDLRYSLGFHLALGITYFNVHGLDYSTDGARKDEAPPTLFYQHSQWPLMSSLLSEVREQAEKLSEGEVVRRVAVLYPSETFLGRFDGTPECQTELTSLEESFHDLSERLIFTQRDYDFVDEATMPRLDLDGMYQVMVLYRIRFIHRQTVDCLRRFQGRVLIIGEMPQVVEDGGRPMALPNGIYGENLTDELLDMIPREDLVGTPLNAICLKHLAVSGRDRYFLFNRSSVPFRGQLNGLDITVPPRCGKLVDGEPAPEPTWQTVERLIHWKVSFDDNAFPLSQGSCQLSDGTRREFDFLNRDLLPSEEESVDWYRFEFCVQGRATPRLKLLLEESSFAGTDYEISLNGHRLPSATPDPVRDCRNLSIDISQLVLTGDYPTRNQLIISTRPGTTLQEMPVVLGAFRLTYPHGLGVMGYLELLEQLSFEPELPLDWSNWGFPAYSGKAVYRASFDVVEPGTYAIRCDCLANALQVKVDGHVVGTALTSPHEVGLGELSGGLHRLELDVYNNPANAVRLGAHPSGILAPIQVMRQR